VIFSIANFAQQHLPTIVIAKKAKEQNSTSTTISRKLEEYADASLKRVQDLVQETQQMM